MEAVERDRVSRLEELTREECMQRLASGSYVGRAAFLLEGRPMILPVNYVLDGVTIVFQTTSGTALSALDEVDVAFEVDNNRPLNHAGWSVVVQGRAVLIRDAGELDRLRRGPLRSWAWRAADIWIAISIDKLSGRHIPEREGG